MEIRALIVDKSPGAAQSIADALRPEIEFTELDYTNSIHRALQSHTDCEYHVCFVSESFPLEELQSFFNDLRKVRGNQMCAFVQVKTTEAADTTTNPDELAAADAIVPSHDQFACAIGRSGTHRDREAVAEALKKVFVTVEARERVERVETSTQLVLEEIDRVAEDRKRGRATPLMRPSTGYLKHEADYKPGIEEHYFEQLEQLTSKAEPAIAEKLDVPEALLARNLPHLSKDTYDGASNRVWKKLANFCGVKSDGTKVKKKQDSEGE